jgi:hypothetical protein
MCRGREVHRLLDKVIEEDKGLQGVNVEKVGGLF